MANAYTARLIPKTYPLLSTSIVNGSYDFPLSEETRPRTSNIIEYFYFVNTEGAPVLATLGSVQIQGSSDGGVTWQDFPEGSFLAENSLSPSRIKPNSVGITTHCRITLDNIVAAGAVGFSALFNQISGV